MIDRSIAPDFVQLSDFTMESPSETILDNGIKLFSFNAHDHDVVNIELVFDAGKLLETKLGVANMMCRLIKSGTTSRNGNELNSLINFLGARVQANHSLREITVGFCSLSKNFLQTAQLVEEILLESTFPEKELSITKNQLISVLFTNNSKTKHIANKTFNENLYGTEHILGKYSTEDDINNVTREDILLFYKNIFQDSIIEIHASGHISDEVIHTINTLFGNLKAGKGKLKIDKYPSANSSETKKIYTPWENALQTSIKVGKFTIGREDSDSTALSVLNTALGGYFGSRLMQNIREEKGYTYGIHSSYLKRSDLGVLAITTSVKKEFREETFSEIHKEITRLCTTKIEDKELSLIKNYMAGVYLNSLHSVFETASYFKYMRLSNLKKDYYNTYVSKIQSISSNQLLEVANKELSSDFLEISIG